MSIADLLARELPPLVQRRHLLRLGVSENDVDRVWRAVGEVTRPAGSRNSYVPRERVVEVFRDSTTPRY